MSKSNSIRVSKFIEDPQTMSLLKPTLKQGYVGKGKLIQRDSLVTPDHETTIRNLSQSSIDQNSVTVKSKTQNNQYIHIEEGSVNQDKVQIPGTRSKSRRRKLNEMQQAEQ